MDQDALLVLFSVTLFVASPSGRRHNLIARSKK
jgi:hypothetical protein